MTDKQALIQPDRGQKSTAIHLVCKDNFAEWARTLSPAQRATLEGQKFTGSAGEVGIVPDGDGWFAAGGVADPVELTSWCLARLAEALPEGTYALAKGDPGRALLGWQTAQYRFTRYREDKEPTGPRILLTKDAKAIAQTMAEAAAIALVRDLVNTPAEDMGPSELEAAAEKLARAHKAELHVVHGDALQRDYPMIHAVGRAASRHNAPRLIELAWGDPKSPRIAIVGKGVCFDSGGLDIKPSSGMLLMKKDMGGAAHALALAGLVMDAGMDVRLHLLIPAVENAVSGNAFRPGDVLKSRQGLSVEIGNTDAEGRLILGDALTRASEEQPELIIDFATLTGAARVALGPELPALFARQDETADALLAVGRQHDDEVWRLPLYEPYAEWLKSDIADINNTNFNGFAGATVAALFLDRFVAAGIDWVHFDTWAWRQAAKPGRPKGGEALGLRAAWHMLYARYG